MTDKEPETCLGSRPNMTMIVMVSEYVHDCIQKKTSLGFLYVTKVPGSFFLQTKSFN